VRQTLTDRQREILEFIKAFIRKERVPPTVMEICEHFGFATSSCFDHLKALQRKGYLTRTNKARSIQVAEDSSGAGTILRTVEVPLIGAVAAGAPITAHENVEGTFTLDRDLVGGDGIFMVRVQGDSMSGAGILDGDLALVREQPTAKDGDIVVALIEDEVTVKRLRRSGKSVILAPENPAHDPIKIPEGDSLRIVGRIVGLFRRL